jgi:hypothetical protein
MSDYIKTTNFSIKDTLPSGNANKVVRGTELNDEFTAIQSAVQSKADKDSPALTGTPTAPTAASGTNTTQLATTAFVKTAVDTSAATLTTSIGTKADKTTTITAGAGLTGGGDLSSNRTLSIASTSMGYGTRTVSTSDPTGGTDGDIWLKV